MNKPMKYTLLLGILISFSGTNLIAQSTNDSLKPKMKMIKEVIYKPDNLELKNRENLFDSNISSYIIFDKNDKVIESGQYEIDAFLYEKIIYERNEEGEIEKGIKKDSSNEVVSYWTYVYDSKRNIIEVNTYDSKNQLTDIQTNDYDEYGNNIEMLLKTPGSQNSWKYIYKYNSENQKIEQLRYKPDGSLKDRRTYSYDEDGNENIEYKFSPDGSFMKFVSEYDKMKNITIQYWFNEQEELTDQTKFEYVYDKNGNWITKKRRSNGELDMVWERKIDYYE